jgi:Domain of unknown function (DUF5666)
MKNYKSMAAASLMVILLAACGSTGIGDILGGGSPTSQSRYDIQGTVESVDLNSRAIYLTNVSGYNSSMLSNGGASSVRVYYDDNTPVSFNGQSYRPSDLERGDQVTVRADESGNNLVAESVTVTRDASSGTSSSYPTYPSNGSSTYNQTIRGTVSYVDTANRTIELQSASWINGFNSNTTGSAGTTVIHYDANTQIDVAGRLQAMSGLERGDVIEVQVSRDSNNSALWAQRAFLVRDVNQR